MTRQRSPWCVAGVFLISLVMGCGTTRMTDTPRSAKEMLLVTQAVDNAVARIDFSPLAARSVFLDPSGVSDREVDKGYLISLVKQQLLASGARLQQDKQKADFIVELRSGGLGTDRHDLLIGTPSVQLPSVVPGIPTNIPEVSLIKKNDQRGVAKVAVFAYHRETGRALWQSGTVEAESQIRDTWVFGAGPFTRGSLRDRTELAGQPLPTIPITFWDDDQEPAVPGLLDEQYFPPDNPPVVPAALSGVTGMAPVVNTSIPR